MAVLAALFLLPGASIGETFDVRARGGSDGEWRPDALTIERGDRVVWSNPTNRRHNVVAYRGDWDKNTMLEPGETTAKRFRETGRYKYRCRLHSTFGDGRCLGMCGKVRVVLPSGPNSGPGA